MPTSFETRDGVIALLFVVVIVALLTDSLEIGAAVLALGSLYLGAVALVRRQHRH
jgi:uncharacterized membrane protein